MLTLAACASSLPPTGIEIAQKVDGGPIGRHWQKVGITSSVVFAETAGQEEYRFSRYYGCGPLRSVKVVVKPDGSGVLYYNQLKYRGDPQNGCQIMISSEMKSKKVSNVIISRFLKGIRDGGFWQTPYAHHYATRDASGIGPDTGEKIDMEEICVDGGPNVFEAVKNGRYHAVKYNCFIDEIGLNDFLSQVLPQS